MLDAKDPYVRAAAAVYMTFEDEKKGTELLKKMRKLEGDPGLWVHLRNPSNN